MDPEVHEVVARYVREIDEVAPGLVEGLYLVGSVALGDYHSGHSDVDFVAVLGRELTDDDLTVLETLHGGMPHPPWYDGIYVHTDQLGIDDSDVVAVHEGKVERDRWRTPVTWYELGVHGVVVRGAPIRDLRVPVDVEWLRSWMCGNLKAYWEPYAQRCAEGWANLPDDDPLDAFPVTWMVLGAPRLHYTLATNQVTTKTGSGRYAVQMFPAWSELVERVIQWRMNLDVSFFVRDGRAAVDLVDAVIEDAGMRWCEA